KLLYVLKRSPLYWLNTLVLVPKEVRFYLILINLYLFTNKAVGALLVLYINNLLIVVPIITIVN
ncbi:hypothetical protein QR685DRAFT_446055, partial [Neurospora intermedia]